MAAGVVIVGGGLAGGAVAAHLQEEGYSGPIVVIDDDPDAPYDRPPLESDNLLSLVDLMRTLRVTEGHRKFNPMFGSIVSRQASLGSVIRVVALAV